MTGLPPSDLSVQHVAALRRTLEHVLAHPDEHRQDVWGYRFPPGATRGPVCGTAFCLAGHAAVTVAGARPRWSPEGYLVDVDVYRDGGAARVEVDVYAAEVLGLDDDQAGALFYHGNTRVVLAELVRELTRGEVDLVDEARRVDAELGGDA